MSPNLSSPTPAAGAQLMQQLAEAAAIYGACASGLLPLLGTSEAPVADPAGALGLDPAATERVLDLLVHAGLAHRGDQGWHGTAWLRTADGQVIAGLDGLCASYRGVEAFLAGAHAATARRAVAHTPHVVRGLARVFEDCAAALAADLGPCAGEVLDLGAGSAVWSLAMLVRDGESTALAVDRPEVLEAARHRAAALGLLPRFRALPGDLWALALPRASCARAILANVLHLFEAEAAAALVHRAAGTLRPGGQLVIVDVDAPRGDPLRDAYALHLRMRVPTGTVHSPEDLAAMCRQAGLRAPRRLHLGPADGSIASFQGALIATRP